MEKTESTQITGNARRKILSLAVSQILMEKGFDSADKECLETLTEMLQSCEWEIFTEIIIKKIYIMFFPYSFSTR